MTTFNARPFLKWAGGKKQLLDEFYKRFPDEMKMGKIQRYVEPFVGGGAVFFFVATKFRIKECHIFDINEELFLTYNVVKNDVDELVEALKALESEFFALNTGRGSYYYRIREQFNKSKNELNFNKYNHNWIERAAQVIFLNRTCFNGLFRVNSNGEFNVPYGRYKNPSILNEENLRNVSKLLENTEIHLGDFANCEPLVDSHTFVYLDPPYRPLNQTSSFTSYYKSNFNDKDHKRLAEFYKVLDKKGAKLMLSNSDPKNENSDDDFFEELYSGFRIERVPARRMINCNGAKRGAIDELVIINYNASQLEA